MEAVIGLMVMMLGVSQGVETSCDGRQDGAQCFGALGGAVAIQLMDSASEIQRYTWSKNTSVIFDGRRLKIITNKIKNRSSFTVRNGTFRINKLSRRDGGEYKLETFNSNGKKLAPRTLQLIIQGVETSCDGRQDGAQCFGALGGAVAIQLMDSASEIHRYVWSKNTSVIFEGRRLKIITNKIKNRSSFTFSNGTFRIDNLNTSDGGQYKLQTFDSNGKKLAPRTLQLIIQAPVSSVLLHSECLSQGEMRVSCSSEGGDSPQYSWTLDGRTLKDAELLPGRNETSSITLKQHVSGRLACSVRNNVSRVSEEEKISNCGFIYINCTLCNGMHISQWVFAANNTLCIQTTTAPTTITETVDHSQLICGVRAAVVILILIGITVYYAWKKKKYKMAEGSAVHQRMLDQENSVVMVEMRSSSYENFDVVNQTAK